MKLNVFFFFFRGKCRYSGQTWKAKKGNINFVEMHLNNNASVDRQKIEVEQTKKCQIEQDKITQTNKQTEYENKLLNNKNQYWIWMDAITTPVWRSNYFGLCDSLCNFSLLILFNRKLKWIAIRPKIPLNPN